jgi:hypothetical protein
MPHVIEDAAGPWTAGARLPGRWTMEGIRTMADPHAALSAMKSRAESAAAFRRDRGQPVVTDLDAPVLYQSLVVDAPAAYTALGVVLALHRPDEDGDCSECDRFADPEYTRYPCPTVRAIADVLDGL